MLAASLFGESLAGNVGVFLICSVVIGALGTRITVIADQLADRAGWGEALVGGVLLGAVTSLSGSVLSVSAALHGEPVLALSNALGGMGAQMAFLAVADICYRKANLEHAAASTENMVQGSVLVCVLSIMLMGRFAPQWTFAEIHVATPMMIGAYAWGMYLVKRTKERPMWQPLRTLETLTDEPESRNEKLSFRGLVTRFAVFGVTLGVAGWALQGAASGIVQKTAVSAAVMGTLFTSVATSLPELVTSIAAVRRGALTLAVSGIIGGNAYDTLFAAFSDVAYREGSIYSEMTPTIGFWAAINLLMTGVLIMGLLFRQKRGMANIGFESVLLLVLYALGAVVVVAGGGGS